MKKQKRIAVRIVMLVAMVLVMGCEEESTFKIEETQEIIFHYSYENFSGGYEFAGWCIDKEGVVYGLEGPLHWNDEIDNIVKDSTAIYWYEKDNLEQGYAAALGKPLGKVRDSEMKKRIEEIEDIENESHSFAVNDMADSGTAIYGFLSFDSQTQKYRKVILELSGDWYSVLEDEYAEELTHWLRMLQEDIGYPDFK